MVFLALKIFSVVRFKLFNPSEIQCSYGLGIRSQWIFQVTEWFFEKLDAESYLNYQETSRSWTKLYCVIMKKNPQNLACFKARMVSSGFFVNFWLKWGVECFSFFVKILQRNKNYRCTLSPGKNIHDRFGTIEEFNFSKTARGTRICFRDVLVSRLSW